MSQLRATFRSVSILALAAGLAGCQDPVATIKADRRAVERVYRPSSDRPAKPQPSKSTRKRPDPNDLSPKLPSPQGRGVETQP
jgi:hypothetical protein